jgi:cell division protein FtsB
MTRHDARTAESGRPAPPPSDLRRIGLRILFWFIALSLLFNSLFGDMGLIQGFRQRGTRARLGQEVAMLRQQNATLAGDIEALRRDPYRIETVAREDLGLSRPGEILFLFQNGDAAPPGTAPSTGAVR